MADFVESIWNDPNLNSEAKALIKKKYPNLAIPEYDLEQRVEKRLNDEREARERVEAQRKGEEDKKRFEALRSETQKKYGFTDKGMEELEEFMVKENVGSYDVAGSYKASREPKPSDVNFSDGRWNHQESATFKEISADPEKWARGEILKTLYNQRDRERNQKF